MSCGCGHTGQMSYVCCRICSNGRVWQMTIQIEYRADELWVW